VYHRAGFVGLLKEGHHMSRASVLIFALTVAFLSGTAVTTGGARPAPDKPADPAPVAVGHRTAVFNMAAVMRDMQLAKYRVWQLNEMKADLSKPVVKLRADYERTQTSNTPQRELTARAQKLLELSTQIKEAEAEVNKKLNADATVIISDLYDKIKEVVDATAKRDGFKLVFAYPDAVTPEELASPYIKELKLKPPAAQPFYVAPDVDITERVVNGVNKKFPPIDAETGKPVDVSQLKLPEGVPAPAAPKP
jgi:Skp family chaperone for outer membrane proteins